MRDVKGCLEFLEQHYPEEVLRAPVAIDPKECDHAAWQELLAEKNRFPWVVFENVKAWDGSRWPGYFTNVNMSNFRRIALLYGLDITKSTPFDVVLKHYEGKQNPVPPVEISTGEAPVKEVVLSGEKARLDILPIWRNAIHDSRPGWLTPIWGVRDPETGRYNFSWHRGQCLDPKRTAVRFYPPRHIYNYFQAYKAMGKNMPSIAILGHHPSFYAAACTSYSLEMDEYDGVSGIVKAATGEPLRVVPSATWGKDFLIPADAEVVMEGEIDIEAMAEVGQWCDAWRFYAPPSKMNVFKVSAINMRQRPILEGVIPKDHIIPNLCYAADAYEVLKHRFPGVKSVFVPFIQTLIVSVKPSSPAESSNIALSLYQLGSDRVKHVILVDEDVNPYDLSEIFFALVTRVDARQSVQIVNTMTNPNDTAAKGYYSGRAQQVGGLIIDATRPYEPFPEVGVAPDEVRRRNLPALLEMLKGMAASSKWSWSAE